MCLFTPNQHPGCPLVARRRHPELFDHIVGAGIRNVGIVAERPNGLRVPFMSCPTPLVRASNGGLIGAFDMLVPVGPCRSGSRSRRLATFENSHRVVHGEATMDRTRKHRLIQAMASARAPAAMAIDPTNSG